MFGETAESEDRRGESENHRPEIEGRDGGGGVLRRLLPYAGAFAAGFLLARRRRDDGTAATGGEGKRGEQKGRLSEIATEVRQRAMPEAGSTTGEGGGTTGETETADAEGATDQPSSMGSVAGEQAREREREGEQGETVEADAEVAELSPPTAHGMPMFGLGTYQMDDYDECVESVRTALGMGYRHVDTAEGYDNETAVGDAIAEAEVGREDLFVATKVSPENLAYDRVLTNAEESLEQLGLDAVDLLYVHWPTDEYDPTDTLDAFAKLRQEGLIEEIGVSNFTVDLLKEAIEVSEEPIFANQVEMHPLLPQTELRQFCAQDDVDVELVAYSPIARGDVADVDEIREVAEKHDATPQQVSLAWLREKEVTAIPKATGEEHLRENWLSLGLELDDEDVEKIDSIEERKRLVDPDRAPWNR